MPLVMLYWLMAVYSQCLSEAECAETALVAARARAEAGLAVARGAGLGRGLLQGGECLDYILLILLLHSPARRVMWRGGRPAGAGARRSRSQETCWHSRRQGVTGTSPRQPQVIPGHIEHGSTVCSAVLQLVHVRILMGVQDISRFGF